ncbi:MAG: hypothetical protein H0T80_08535 [Betaproteobacteria bacterium]|nr:hypothetical protein [Betaproteobacteria bacterium]
MTRRCRRRFALFALLGFVFAQFSLTAYACPKQAGSAWMLPASAISGCAEQLAVAPPAGNLCEVHCLDGVSSVPPTANDAPAADFTVFALPAAFPPVITVSGEWQRTARDPMATAPPLPVRFCRFLI